MVESFLVSLAMAILKYYAPIGVTNVLKWWQKKEQLKENAEKSKDYEDVVDSNASREDRRAAEDRLLD